MTPAEALPGMVRVSAPPQTILQTGATDEQLLADEEQADDATPPDAVSPKGLVPVAAVRNPTAANAIRRSTNVSIQFTAAEERIPATPDDCTASASQAELAQAHPDEYLFDGGDRALPVHRNGYNIEGLETEDTVVQFKDEEGKRHLKPTNRVAIYAPRFAAVASVSGPTEGMTVGKLAGASTTAQGGGLRSRQATTFHEQREGTDRLLVRSRASGLETKAGQRSMVQPVKPATNEQALRSSGTVNFLRTGQFTNTDEAHLALGIQAAVTWTREQNPVIAAKTDSAGELKIRAVAAQIEGLEISGRKGDLRIVKLADKKVASPGDVVSFTIRYDNVGDREVRDVMIVDNLTPRLAYIEGSATNDRPGHLEATDNGEGSALLQWTFDEPLAGHTGGVVTFQARVR